MKKLIVGFIMMSAFLFNIAPTHAQQTPTVTFDGTTSLKYNVDVNQFGDVFQDMFPSETRTLNIQLKNTTNKSVDFYMSTEILEAFEDALSATNGAYQVTLTLNQDNQKTIIYGQEDALIGANENGLYDLNGALNDKFMVTKLSANQDAVISLNITLDGISQRNGYQSLPATMKFDFTAQYDEPQTNTIINQIINTKYVDQVITKIQTGDPTTITILVVALVGAGAVTAILLRRGGKKNDE